MNYLDIILAIPLIWGLYKGFSNGIIIELATLLALVFGIYGALHFTAHVQPYLKETFSIDSSFLPIISFAFTFIVIVLIVKLVGLVTDRLVKFISLGFLSRILGGVFGVLKIAFLISSILLVFNTFDYHLQLISSEQKKSSLLYRPVCNMLTSIIPDVSDAHSLIEEAERVWNGFDTRITPQK